MLQTRKSRNFAPNDAPSCTNAICTQKTKNDFWKSIYQMKTTTPTMTEADSLLKTGMTVYATAKKLNVANSSLRIRIINGRRELTCRECGAVVPIRFGDHRRAFCSERCSRRWHSRKGARQRYAKKHGGKREIVCKFCGVTFVKEFGDPRRDYCSAACRYNAMIARLHAKRQTPDKFFCLMCGAEIVKKHGDKRLKYCSALCMEYYNKYLMAKNKQLVYRRFLEAKERQNGINQGTDESVA